MRIRTLLFIILVVLIGCSRDGQKTNQPDAPAKIVNVPSFNADSAYYFVKKQVDFGPRIPNSAAHKKAGDYFIAQLKTYGAVVKVQEFTATTFTNEKISLRNIIASFNPDKKKRILLAAHWDTRPVSSKDEEKPNAAFDGANDGASGVGVLLEVARIIGKQPTDAGIDIILFDGEDWGFDTEDKGTWGIAESPPPLPPGLESWWCLGSQHWSKNKHLGNYTAAFGILLDMVGGKNAQFAYEGVSLDYAAGVVDKVWKSAAKLGFSHVFITEKDGQMIDDHLFVNIHAKIPMIDIVSYAGDQGYGDFHHTQKDNMSSISKETLHAVGQTLLQVIYYE
jgi:Zn-dependent M28 family amino/carboxypeptidase